MSEGRILLHRFSKFFLAWESPFSSKALAWCCWIDWTASMEKECKAQTSSDSHACIPSSAVEARPIDLACPAVSLQGPVRREQRILWFWESLEEASSEFDVRGRCDDWCMIVSSEQRPASCTRQSQLANPPQSSFDALPNEHLSCLQAFQIPWSWSEDDW